MNRLVDETSPYLRSHASQPVDWYPWGEEAFAAAQGQDKPIFLSIGYATCHWCHVMARETFSDPDIAEIMNRAFINVKVDREERPDIDAVYMSVCQAMTGTGGWPLSLFLTPGGEPFYAGTYLPPSGRQGRPGMRELAQRIEGLWRERRSELRYTARRIAALFAQWSPPPGEEISEISLLSGGFDGLADAYDPVHGGFGAAPKFPMTTKLLYLLRAFRRFQDDRALAMVEDTLRSMRRGGIYDHVGFGFHRYATDARWFLPHFEKMLYDQALIALAYLEAGQATGRWEYLKTAREVITYVLSDLRSPQGAFYCARDADTEGEEGRFYLWEAEEIRRVLPPREGEIFLRVFGVKDEGNIDTEGTGLGRGTNVLHQTRPLELWAAELGLSRGDLERVLEGCRRLLQRERERRITPFRDEKILTDWNGLMIAALACAARVLDDETYLEAARDAAGFVLAHLKDDVLGLLHCRRQGGHVPAFLDDYAFLVWGLIELYESSYDRSYLETAVSLNRDLLEGFWDDEGGGFFFTSRDHERLLYRRKTIQDGAVPAGNAAAAMNLLRLARLTGEARLEDRVRHMTKTFAGTLGQAPSEASFFLCALDFLLGPSYEIVIAASFDSPLARTAHRALWREYYPNKVVLLVGEEEGDETVSRLCPWDGKTWTGHRGARIYVCTDRASRPPTTDIGEVLDIIRGES